MIKKPWFLYALTTTVFWGIWGALIELPGRAGFPSTLVYIVWAITMIPCSLVGLYIINWKIDLDVRSVIYGLIIGLTGAGGQVALFKALSDGPAYLVFPIVSLSPAVTVILSVIFLKESTSRRNWIGIIIALFAIVLMSFQKPDNKVITGFLWFILSLLVFLAWGIQAFFIKKANNSMKAESIFFYMMVSGLIVVPFAFCMTDFNENIYWGFRGPYLAALISTLNSVGALTLVYAIRYGKVIIVAPLTNAVAPLITVVLSLIIYSILPNPVIVFGIVLAMISVYLLAD